MGQPNHSVVTCCFTVANNKRLEGPVVNSRRRSVIVMSKSDVVIRIRLTGSSGSCVFTFVVTFAYNSLLKGPVVFAYKLQRVSHIVCQPVMT